MSERESILNQGVRDSLEIHHFIYHIIETQSPKPDYLESVQLTGTQEHFFKDMLLETAKGTRYQFSDKANNTLVKHCQEIIADPDNKFVGISKLIVSDFKKIHQGPMSDGIVIVAYASMIVGNVKKYFIALLKVDYTKVLAQKRDPNNKGHVSFTEIADTLSEDKKAIQKRALIDVSSTFDWDVLAVERGKTASTLDTEIAITKYFKDFLGVQLQRVDSSYSRMVPTKVYQWAKANGDPVAYLKKAKAVDYIKANDGSSISMDDIRDLVCLDPDAHKQVDNIASFDTFMDKHQFNGVQFVARKNSIVAKDEVTKIKTNKQVIIEWPGKPEDAGVTITTLADGTIEHKVISQSYNVIDK
ncbi:nucleoid-associated protein [Shewanella sp. D64]|uniref:nucleoid-associated protein n=1 Tax=unclassified Shewanella TaxID=196818 RepID=UPI0022BA5EB8|nr:MULTISPECIES: nucleoid-associated protein [unclassified Shewanella]MEC4724538.1 nucleoid-associated protein [Shewanella sp. D64]MEC4736685.1 nucleoid-associated protein [Shewanella sp. E94]WBJ94645.1 nucleoid-associated protein [Shewanella sp. MTB7]